VLGVLLSPGQLFGDGIAADKQLDEVRARISSLESRLVEVEDEKTGVSEEKARLNTELELAQARVHEIELVLTSSRDEAVSLRAQAAQLADEIVERRQFLIRSLELLALLGQPGPLQLLFDASQGGDLERAAATVTVLTKAQAQLVVEYRQLMRQRKSRLAALSRVLESAQREATQLIRRRNELEETQAKVDKRLRQLQHTQRSARTQLADLRQREQALESLLTTLASRDRVPDAENIQQYRGALPWPAEGPVVLGFGKHYLPKYATYTVCNGIRLNVAGDDEIHAVFTGEVAFARQFKGYGNMVVVDHGNEVYSLVAGLATIYVRLNQRVEMGTPLGIAAPQSDEGNTYLEIRVASKPEDPRRWLQLRKESS